MCRGFPEPQMEGPGLRSGLAGPGGSAALGPGSAGRKRCFGTGREVGSGRLVWVFSPPQVWGMGGNGTVQSQPDHFPGLIEVVASRWAFDRFL
ncbi:hypothetical protein NN561_002939 [Cricetulus griseus]